MLIVQCRGNYPPGTDVTTDEQLLTFRGWFKLEMYIANTPTKYGLKLEMMYDVSTRYMIDSKPNLEKVNDTGGVLWGCSL